MEKRRPSRIVYVRHPVCLHNISNDDALRSGIPNRLSPLVTPLGELQRDITAEYLVKTFGKFDAVFCSEFVRTHEIPTACGFRAQMTESAHINERNMGVWHIHPRAKVLEMHPGEGAVVEKFGYYDYQAPGGETCAHVEDRLRQFVDSPEMAIDGTVFISAHGISGLCMRRVLTGSSKPYADMERLKNASVSVFEFDGETYRCVSWNVVPWEGKIDSRVLAQGTEA